MIEGQADLHIHTNAGDGILSIEQVLEQAESLGLSAIAITDHDNVIPSLSAWELAAKKRLAIDVVTGAEVTTRGFRHLLALNIEENVPFGLPLLVAISRIHKQGGLAIAAHPLVPIWPGSLREKEIFSVLFCPDKDIYFDGFEVLNGSIKNNRARNFYKQYLLGRAAAVAGSDAHFKTIGKAMTIYPQELGVVRAIREKRTRVAGGNRIEEKSAGDYLRNFGAAIFKEPRRRGKILPW